MKTIAILSLVILLITAGNLSAQKLSTTGHRAISQEARYDATLVTDCSMLDKIQMETEAISGIKPFLFIAAIIEGRLDLHRLEKESVAAARSRETGSK
jgi:hypothetical protein